MIQRLSNHFDNLFFHVFLRVGWWVLLGKIENRGEDLEERKNQKMKKYYITSWSVTIGWILFLSIIDAYLYFGIPDSNKTITLVTWLIGVTGMLAVTITCNIVKRKNNEK